VVRIVVDGDNGSVNVAAGNAGAVDVSAELRRPDDLEYSVIQEDDVIQVKFGSKRSNNFGPRPGARVTITAPASAILDLRTSNCKIEVSGVLGPGELRTSNGKIEMTDVK